LHEGSEFTDTTTLVTKNFLGMCCADNDFSSGGGDADFTAGIALFGEFPGKEFVQFGKENAVGDKLGSAFVQAKNEDKC
jgi:hypothetical protein